MTSSARLQQEADVARAGLSSALDELKSSVTSTALTNGAMTFAKEGSSAVAKAAVDRAVSNPLAAMLIGAGLFMLMSTRKDGTSPVGDLAERGKEAVKSAVGSMSSSASETATSASDKMTDLADRATEGAKDMMVQGEERMDGLRARAHDLRDQAQDLTAKGRDEAERLMEQGRSSFDRLSQEQPILVAALGVALGAALGAALPITKSEQEYLGEAARKIRDKAAPLATQVADAVTGTLAGDDAAHKVSQVVESVSSTVTQGLRQP